MKQITFISAIFLLTVLPASGQEKEGWTARNNRQELIDSLKKEVDQSWISENPVLGETKSSYFTNENENNYFIGVLQVSGYGVPFTWDANLSLLQFMLTSNNNATIKRGAAADSVYKGIKIAWDKNISALIWFDDNTYNATVDNWHLFESTECPGTIIFPNLSFEKVVDVPNATTNDIDGLTIIPYAENITVKSSDTALETASKKEINGTGYDLNDDDILDVFSYTEEIDEITNYTRLYLNVNGQWKCKWIHLDEVCID